MCLWTWLQPAASAIAEPAASEEDHEGHHQQQPKQRTYTDSARDGSDYQDDQKQLYKAHQNPPLH